MSNKKQESLSKWFTKGNRNKQKAIKEIETNKVLTNYQNWTGL